MRYMIEEADGLYCVYRWDNIGWRIVSAHETVKEAKEAVKKYRSR